MGMLTRRHRDARPYAADRPAEDAHGTRTGDGSGPDYGAQDRPQAQDADRPRRGLTTSGHTGRKPARPRTRKAD
jgi:hypothetical protein